MTGGTARDDRDLAGDVQIPAARGRALRVVRIPTSSRTARRCQMMSGRRPRSHRAPRERAPGRTRLAEPRLLGQGVRAGRRRSPPLAGLGLRDQATISSSSLTGLLALARHVDGPYVDAASSPVMAGALQRVVSSGAGDDAGPRPRSAHRHGGDECRMVCAREINLLPPR